MTLIGLIALMGCALLTWTGLMRHQRLRRIVRAQGRSHSHLIQKYLPTLHVRLNPGHKESVPQLKGVGEAGFRLLHEVEDLLKVGLAPLNAWQTVGVHSDERGIPITRSVEYRLLWLADGTTGSSGHSGIPDRAWDVGQTDTRHQQNLPAHERELARSLAHLVVVAAVVSQQLGLSLSAVFATVQGTLRRSIEAEEERRISLAGPQASARLLQLLPLVGLGGAYLLGADPISWYLTSPLGAVVGVAGTGLLLSGRAWTRRLIRQAKATT
jgi:hypothetical protein